MGIDPARIDTRGLGSAKPLVSTEGSIEEQQLNRRVEIVILRGDGGR
jgi:outer membrane protein OmpA-like peptidoglycan-associated protein